MRRKNGHFATLAAGALEHIVLGIEAQVWLLSQAVANRCGSLLRVDDDNSRLRQRTQVGRNSNAEVHGRVALQRIHGTHICGALAHRVVQINKLRPSNVQRQRPQQPALQAACLLPVTSAATRAKGAHRASHACVRVKRSGVHVAPVHKIAQMA